MKEILFIRTGKAAIALALFMFSTLGFSQDGTPEAPKTFRELFTEGGYHMEYKSFNLAVPTYLEALKLEPENANIHYRIGFCYNRYADDKAIAIPYLLKAIAKATRNYDDLSFTEKNAPQQAHYELARAYHLSDQLDSAISNYTRFGDMLNKKHYMQEDVAKQLEQCNYAKEQMANPINVKITNLGEGLNTKYGDYTPVVTADESMMIFTSRRKGSTGGDNNLEFDNRFFEDIYITTLADGKWIAPEKITGGINTNDHDAVISLSADGQKLYTYSTDGGGDISLSFRMGDDWTAPDRLGPTINTEARETHASITPDGKRLYFSSDRGDKKTVQYGGLDLYMATKLPNGEWSEATNLGDVINTDGDDDAPFIHPNGTRLYYSSKGLKTMGGYDIFYSDLKDDGTWSTPVNLGYPINTTKDDIYYVESPDGKRAYYSSVNAELGYGRSDLYLVEMPEKEEVKLTMLTGVMEVQMEDGIALESKIIVKDPSSGEETVYTPNAATGEYLIILPPGAEYEVSYTVEDSVIVEEKVDLAEQEGYKEIVKTISAQGKIETVEIASTPMVEPDVEVKKQKLLLLESKGGETLMVAELNEEGVFIFESLPDKDNLIFQLDPVDGDMVGKDVRIYRTLDGKQTILTLKQNADGTLILPTTDVVAAVKKQKLLLLDAKGGSTLMTAELDEDGVFVFERLPDRDNLIFQLDPVDGDMVGKDVRIYRLLDGKKTVLTLTKGEDGSLILPVKETVAVVDPVVDIKVDPIVVATQVAVSSFEQNFGYNVKLIKTGSSEYKKMIDDLAKNAKGGFDQVVSIEASASKVPTTRYGTNEKLAQERGNKTEWVITRSIKNKGAGVDKIKFVIVPKVQGPEYKADAIENRDVYRQYQYIKISTK